MSFLNGLRIALFPSYGRWFDEAHPEGPLVVDFHPRAPTNPVILGNYLLGKSAILFNFSPPPERKIVIYGELFFGYALPEEGSNQPIPNPVRVRTGINLSAPGVWTLSAAAYRSSLVGAEGLVAVTASLSEPNGPGLGNWDRPRTATLTLTGDRKIPINSDGFDPGTQAVRFNGTLNYTSPTIDGRLRDARTATDGAVYGIDESVIGGVM